MNKKIEQYIEQLFENAPNTAYVEDLKEEMLSNLLEKYEDLLVEGKSKEEAYIIVTSSVGDIRELLSGLTESAVVITTKDLEKRRKKGALITSIAVMLFILSGAVLIGFSYYNLAELGLVFTIAIVAVGVGLLIYESATNPDELKKSYQTVKKQSNMTTEQKKLQVIKDSISSIIWLVAVAIYIGVSFLTNKWNVTWIVFPITVAINYIIETILELKEVTNSETLKKSE